MSLPRRRSNVSNEPENFCKRSPETSFLVDSPSLEHVRSSSGAKSYLPDGIVGLIFAVEIGNLRN
jgi:hypothetical protein